MLKLFRRLSFKKKILSSYVLFIGLSCLLIGVYCVRSMKTTEEENYSYMQQFCKQVSLDTDVIVSNMERIRYIHFIDDSIKPIIRKSAAEKTISENLEESDYVYRALRHMTAMNQYVLRATIVNEYGEIYSNIQTNNDSYMEKIQKIDQEQDWTDKHKIYYTGVYEENINLVPYELVTSISKIYDIDRDSYIGTLYIDLNFAYIRQILKQSLQSRQAGTELLIFDTQQNIIYESADSENGFWQNIEDKEDSAIRKFLTNSSPTGQLSIGGKKCILSAVTNTTTSWKIAAYIPIQMIYESAWRNMFGILAAMLLLLAAAIILGIILAGQISRPVIVLAEAMKGADQGKVKLIDEEVNKWQDEMGMLCSSYNDMGRRINESIEKIYVYQLNQKQTELKMLQFQINPHFLYNTLNTISSIAALEDIDEIVQIADNLSNMFQYNIKGEDIVPVSRELQHVKNYLGIQGIRFPGRYEFHYEVSSEAKEQKMLKFLLQPLVENSLKHAFINGGPGNQILIIVQLGYDGELYFIVKDNGQGMTEEQTERMNRELMETDTGTLVNRVDRGIGLRNVNARIKNFYGKEYGLMVESERGSYTKVIMKIRTLEKWEREGMNSEDPDCR